MKLKLKNQVYDIIREVADNEHCPYKRNVCFHCPLRVFDTRKTCCSDNAKLLLKLLEGQK